MRGLLRLAVVLIPLCLLSVAPTASAATRLAAPGKLSVDRHDQKTTVRWKPVRRAHSYRVERCVMISGTCRRGRTVAHVRDRATARGGRRQTKRIRYVDRHPTSAKSYGYRVRAVDRKGRHGKWSRLKTVKRTKGGAPAQPGEPGWDDAGVLGPPRRHERDCHGGNVSIVAADNTRYIDCPGVAIPPNAQHVTVVGDTAPASVLKGVVDVYMGGRPGALMNSGPRSDGNDLLQIKRWPIGTGVIPDGITLRWMRFHDLSRPGSEHPDGIQIMAGRNGKILDSRFERTDLQPIFFRYAGETAGGGPIADWTIARTFIQKPPNGYYAIRIAGNGDALVPTRITLRDLTLTADIGIDRAAFNAGFTADNLRNGDVEVFR